MYDDFTTTLQRFVSSAIRPGSDGFMADWLDQEAVQQQTPEVVLVVLGSQVGFTRLWHSWPICVRQQQCGPSDATSDRD